MRDTTRLAAGVGLGSHAEVLASVAGRRHADGAEGVLVPPPVEAAADPDLLPPNQRRVLGVVIQLYLRWSAGGVNNLSNSTVVDINACLTSDGAT